MRSDEIHERVSAELLLRGPRQLPRDACFRDNGKGFDPTARRGGIGINNIRSRARALGGSLRIETAPGRGCTLQVTLPLPAETEEPKGNSMAQQ